MLRCDVQDAMLRCSRRFKRRQKSCKNKLFLNTQTAEQYLAYCCDCILRSIFFLHVLFCVAFFHCIFQHVIASNCRQYDEIILLSSFDILSVVSVSLPSLDFPFLRKIHSSDVWQLLGLVWHEVHLKDTGVFLQAPNVVSKTGSLMNTPDVCQLRDLLGS